MSRLFSLGFLATFVAAGPCDIYASGGTPCVAAHATTRALYDSYNGCLYQVKRASDNGTMDIKPLSAGGVANASTQDTFCSGTSCVITEIYDQSGKGNHLTRAPKGVADSGPGPNGSDALANATMAPVKLNGHKAYGVFMPPRTGYRNDNTTGVATGNEAEGIYAVLNAKHFNGECCFDYGNAETHNDDTGNGHMETINFSNSTGAGDTPKGTGSGPWINADLENGLYSGNTHGTNSMSPSFLSDFVTAWVKGNATNLWSIRGGDADGKLTSIWNGTRPTPNYYPMSKEGAIVLGVGGDNSNRGQGTFYEGALTTGYPSDATENSVQANIVAAKYQVA